MELPEHFDDCDICTVLRNEDTSKLKRYPLTCGLAIKLRTALVRVLKRSILKISERKSLGKEDVTLYKIVEAFTCDVAFLHEHWPSPQILHLVVLEVSIKAINLSPVLQRELALHPLGAPKLLESPRNIDDSSPVELNGIRYAVDPSTCRRVTINYDLDFLRRVKQYHEETRRPEGTFDSPVKLNTSIGEAETPEGNINDEGLEVTNATQQQTSELILTLASLPKDICPQCSGRRQVFCGDCNGLRMENAAHYFPERVELPFEVLLVMHWQETLHKCTGVHVGALCAENTFTAVDWRKEMVPTVVGSGCRRSCDADTGTDAGNSRRSGYGGSSYPAPLREQWKNLVETFDHTRDVLLFPCEGAINAEYFPWDKVGVHNQSLPKEAGSNIDINGKECNKSKKEKWRLVVLEASWNYGKGMAQQLRTHRESVNLPPLPCVQLTNITGQYWKFQTMGHSAVSTIEAITYTARAAALSAATTVTNATATDATVTNAIAINASATDATATDATATDGTATDAIAINASATDATATDATAINASATDASATNAIAINASATDASATDATAINASATDASATDATATDSAAQLVENMLLLFQLQKYRVLQRIEKGGKVPRAVQVSGAGLGCWRELTDYLDEL